jgi:hypothetical protein
LGVAGVEKLEDAAGPVVLRLAWADAACQRKYEKDEECNDRDDANGLALGRRGFHGPELTAGRHGSVN